MVRTRRLAIASLIAALALIAGPEAAVGQASQPPLTPGPYGVEETWTSRDKLYHFGISAVGAGASYTAARKLGMRRWPAVAVSAGLMGAAGVVREIQDDRRADKYFSEKDLLWNTAGITIGIWIPDRLLLRRDDEKPPPWMGGFFGWAARSWWTVIGGAPTVGSRLEPLLPPVRQPSPRPQSG
ncbi:MAG: hypothetical protein KY464_16530 [Gemmatimonadetes bacterium]|nr:hypothetical protein [Gemmatimonadota bacterium]